MIKKPFQSKPIIFILILLIIIILILRFFYSTQPSTNQTSSTIPTQPGYSSTSNPNQTPNDTNSSSSSNSTSSNTISPTPTIEILDLDYRRPLSRLLPYQGTYFRAERYIGTNNLEILVKNKADTQKAKDEALQWLTQHGVQNDDKITVSYRY